MNIQVAKKEALESTETLATVTHAILLKQYGEQVYDWDPVTIAMEVRDDFRAEISTPSMDRWCAMQIVMGSDAFFKRLDAFMNICNTLATGEPFFGVFDPVTVEEAAWSITEVSLNRELLPFSYPVKQYLRQILKQDGYTIDNAPSAIREAFDLKPAAMDVRKNLGVTHNNENINAYIDDQMRDMVYQFNKIPDLKNVDNMILNRSMEEYVNTLISK